MRQESTDQDEIRPDVVLRALDNNPCKTTAIPQPSGPIKYINNPLIQGNGMAIMMMAAQASGAGKSVIPGMQTGKMTRRDITD